MEDFTDPPDLTIDLNDLVVFEFPELSILFDLEAEDVWVEFPTDEQEEIELACAGSGIDPEALSRLPEVTEDGKKMRITSEMLDQMKMDALRDHPAHAQDG